MTPLPEPPPPDGPQRVEGLLERLRAATGPDRELDRYIALRFGWECRPPEGWWRAPNWWARQDTLEGLPYFTASLDAALALVERVLPGQGWNILYRAMMDWRTHVEQDVAGRLPITVLIALLSALGAKTNE